MKYLFPILISVPAAFLVVAFIVSSVLEIYIAADLPEFILFVPFVAFTISLVMIYIKKGAWEWIAATIFNGLPLALFFLIVTILQLVGT
jgi:hypothetical protein